MGKRKNTEWYSSEKIINYLKKLTDKIVIDPAVATRERLTLIIDQIIN